MIFASISLTTLAPLVLVWMQWFDTVDPMWYYIASSLIGMVIFSAMSLIRTDEYRATSYAIILAGFYAGFSLALSSVSIIVTVSALGALVCVKRCQKMQSDGIIKYSVWNLTRRQ